MEKIYCIKNTYDEWGNQAIIGFYSTFEKAKENLKECCDWYKPMGTGRIYKITLDTFATYDLIYEVR